MSHRALNVHDSSQVPARQSCKQMTLLHHIQQLMCCHHYLTIPSSPLRTGFTTHHAAVMQSADCAWHK